MAPVQVCSWQPLTEESWESNRAGGSTLLVLENTSASGRQEEHPLGRELCRQRASRAPRDAASARSCAPTTAQHGRRRGRAPRGVAELPEGANPPRAPAPAPSGYKTPGTPRHTVCVRSPSPAPWLVYVHFFKRCLRIIQLFSQARRR